MKRVTPPVLPLGRLFSMVWHGLRNRVDVALEAATRLGGVVKLPVLGRSIYWISEPSAIRRIMLQNSENYAKGEDYRALALLLGEGLLTANDETWKRDRLLLHPLLLPEKVTAFAPEMRRCVERMTRDWTARCAQDGGSTELSMEPEMIRLTLEIIGHWCFGRDVSPKVTEISALFNTAQARIIERSMSWIDWARWIVTPRERRFRGQLARLHRIVEELIQDTDSSFEGPISLLQRAGRSKTEIRDQLMTFLLAGHETSAVSLTWAFYLLAQKPETFAKLRQEIARVRDGQDWVPTERLGRLEETRQTLDECLRLYPPLTFIGRQLKEDDTLVGHEIPEGSLVGMCPYAAHRSPRNWPEPERFDPSRFSPESRDKIPPGAYLPFALGARRCIGMGFAITEMLIIWEALISDFDFELAPGLGEIRPVPLISMRPDQSVRLRVRRFSPKTT